MKVHLPIMVGSSFNILPTGQLIKSHSTVVLDQSLKYLNNGCEEDRTYNLQNKVQLTTLLNSKPSEGIYSRVPSQVNVSFFHSLYEHKY